MRPLAEKNTKRLYSFEVTLELSCCKFPEESILNKEWEANKNSMVRYLLKVHQGLKGHVKDLNDNALVGAQIMVYDKRFVYGHFKLDE